MKFWQFLWYHQKFTKNFLSSTKHSSHHKLALISILFITGRLKNNSLDIKHLFIHLSLISRGMLIFWIHITRWKIEVAFMYVTHVTNENIMCFLFSQLDSKVYYYLVPLNKKPNICQSLQVEKTWQPIVWQNRPADLMLQYV